MSNKFKDIDIKNSTYYFFGDMINIKYFNLNKRKLNKKSYKTFFFFHYIGYEMAKDPRYIKINTFIPFYQ